MEDGRNLHFVVSDYVGNNIRGAGNHKFACVRHATGPSRVWKAGQTIYGLFDSGSHLARGSEVIPGDIVAN